MVFAYYLKKNGVILVYARTTAMGRTGENNNRGLAADILSFPSIFFVVFPNFIVAYGLPSEGDVACGPSWDFLNHFIPSAYQFVTQLARCRTGLHW